LRSRIGAVVGLLDLIKSDATFIEPAMKQLFLDAAGSANEALAFLDKTIDLHPVPFRVVWILGDRIPRVPNYENIRALTVRLIDREAMDTAVGTYRPDLVVIDPISAGSDLNRLIQRIGPYLSRIYLLSDTAKDQFTPPLPSGVEFLPTSISGEELARILASALRERLELREMKSRNEIKK
jgi:hypothetical protein